MGQSLDSLDSHEWTLSVTVRVSTIVYTRQTLVFAPPLVPVQRLLKLEYAAGQILLEAGGVLLALAGDKISTLARKDTDMDIVSSGKVVPRRATAEKIRRAVTRLGPNFVKIGQALASRPDFVGEAIAGELLLLQDAMPPFSNKVAMELIRQVALHPAVPRTSVSCILRVALLA